ncbi:MAG: carbamoyltransferase C-terminal domain-containing protein [Pseudomonadota bacterium]
MNSYVNILGITCYVHDSAACLIKDGRVIANIEEERLNRQKHTSAFPRQAIDYVLKAGSLTLSDIDIIAFNWHPLKALVSECLKFFFISPPAYFKMLKYNRPPKHFKTILASFFLKKALKKQTGQGFSGRVLWVEHHLAHAASAYYLSSFSKADILVIDGFGEFSASTCLQAEGHTIKRCWRVSALDSLGIVYLTMTRFLGFGLFQEGKTMALASFGRDTCRALFERIIQLMPKGTYCVDKNYLAWWKLLRGNLDPELGLPRQQGEALTQHHMDMAASLQKRVTDSVLHLLKKSSRTTGNKQLCLAGGLFLNCNINAAIQGSGYYEKYFIPPFPSDAGGAVGAALYAAFAAGNEKYIPRTAPFCPFLGPAYTQGEIEEHLIKSGAAYRREEKPGVHAARAIAGSKVVGWLQGRTESGPRALGGRSILANPLDKNIRDYLNATIKKRDYFQPFAPLVTEEAALKYFEVTAPLPVSACYMLLTLHVKKAYRKSLPGITHVDGTSRVQVLRPEWSPALYDLLKEFERLTGFAVVINTSFNQHDPMVCSPADALHTFKASGLDMLVMGNFIIEKEAKSAEKK